MAAASNVSAEDYYRVLGVDRCADEKDIRRAYQKAALRWHPDKNPDNAAEAADNFRRVIDFLRLIKYTIVSRNSSVLQIKKNLPILHYK